MLKKICTIFLSFVVIIGFVFSNSVNSYAYNQEKIQKYINETASLMYKTIPEPTVASIGGEWTVLSLARSGVKIPKSYYDDYYKRVEKTLKDCDGQLHKVKYTEYSRVILALTAMNKDVTDVAGYNLLEYLTDLDNVKKQGINGPIFALIAFDSGNYEIPQKSGVKDQVTRQKLIDFILNKEIHKGEKDAGGWALSGNDPDPDITFMALQALSNYTDQEEVKEAVNRALDVMSKKQLSTGAFDSWGTMNCESTAQAIVALTALGIDVDSDSRFIKTDSNGNKNTVIDGLLYFYCKGGGFAHVLEGYDGGGGAGTGLNAMATDQGMYALVAYNRYLKGQNKLYDMTDASTTFSTGDNPDLNGKDDGDDDNDNQNNNNENNNSNNQNSNSNSENKNNQNTKVDSSGNTTYTSKVGNKSVKTTENKSATISIKTVYTGEKDGLIPEKKKCVIIEFKEKEKEEIVEFKLSKDKKQYLYYSQELSDKSNTPTYIALFDTSVEKEDLLKMENYEFHKIEEAKVDQNASNEEADYTKPEKYEIIFGDVNGDKVINAQDVLDVQSILSGKLDLTDEKQIIAINVSMDSKIDNGDIEQIMNNFLSKSEYTIFKIWDDKVKDNVKVNN
ncbi:hypothetical protein [Intestinibacter sp.]|uniref:hypothetical protein n=1 Tax=Intestinibacter sp. TaxID=1965304 RepID=UPI003F137129